MNKLIWWAIVFIAIVVGGYFLFNNFEFGATGSVITGSAIVGEIIDEDQNMKTFVLTGKNYKFMGSGEDNPVLKVKKGEKVRINFLSVDGFHDWVVDEFDVATKRVNEGGSSSIEFVADKKGEFEYYCSVGQHRELGMKGMLIVE